MGLSKRGLLISMIALGVICVVCNIVICVEMERMLERAKAENKCSEDGNGWEVELKYTVHEEHYLCIKGVDAEGRYLKESSEVKREMERQIERLLESNPFSVGHLMLHIVGIVVGICGSVLVLRRISVVGIGFICQLIAIGIQVPIIGCAQLFFAHSVQILHIDFLLPCLHTHLQEDLIIQGGQKLFQSKEGIAVIYIAFALLAIAFCFWVITILLPSKFIFRREFQFASVLYALSLLMFLLIFAGLCSQAAILYFESLSTVNLLFFSFPILLCLSQLILLTLHYIDCILELYIPAKQQSQRLVKLRGIGGVIRKFCTNLHKGEDHTYIFKIQNNETILTVFNLNSRELLGMRFNFETHLSPMIIVREHIYFLGQRNYRLNLDTVEQMENLQILMLQREVNHAALLLHARSENIWLLGGVSPDNGSNSKNCASYNTETERVVDLPRMKINSGSSHGLILGEYAYIYNKGSSIFSYETERMLLNYPDEWIPIRITIQTPNLQYNYLTLIVALGTHCLFMDNSIPYVCNPNAHSAYPLLPFTRTHSPIPNESHGLSHSTFNMNLLIFSDTIYKFDILRFQWKHLDSTQNKWIKTNRNLNGFLYANSTNYLNFRSKDLYL